MIEDESMKAKETDELGKERVLGEETLGVMSVKGLEIVVCDELLSESLLYIVLL